MAVDMDDWRVDAAIDWLCTPRMQRDPASQTELCAQLSISGEVFRRWKRDPAFVARWEERSRELVGSPERAQEVLDALFETAKDREDPRQVPAARAYMEWLREQRAAKGPTGGSAKAVQDMTDEELRMAIAAEARIELERRGGE